MSIVSLYNASLPKRLTMDEKKITHFMQALDISRDEAIQLIADDESDNITDAGEKLTQRAKENINRYTRANVENKKTSRLRKVDSQKKGLLDMIAAAINDKVIDLQVETETALHFHYCNECYTLKLIKHRKKGEKRQ